MNGNDRGLSDGQYWTLVVVAVAALILVLVGISMAVNNSALRQETTARQQYINQSLQLVNFHNQLVQGLATLAARSGDDALRDVLARHGVTYSVSDQGAGSLDAAGGSTATGLEDGQ
jgi:hypothetical protein